MSTILELPSRNQYLELYAAAERLRREVEQARKQLVADLLDQRKGITNQLKQLGYEGLETSPPLARKNGKTDDDGPKDAEGNALDPSAPIFLAGSFAKDTGVRRKRATAKFGKRASISHCPVCDIDGHDLRAHRGQAVKRPYSQGELMQKGLTVAT